MRETILRYVWSSGVTFVAGMAIVVVPTLNGDLTLEVVTSGAYLGVIFAGARLGFKMVLEGFLNWKGSDSK